MIWSRNKAARSYSRLAAAICISSSNSRSTSVILKSPPPSRITDSSSCRPFNRLCKLSCTARLTLVGVIPFASLYAVCVSIGEENDLSIYVSRGSAGCLDERSLTSQKSFLVGVQNADQADFRQ